ncbi:hypothetical protein B6U98_02125, partial [Thermoplasmatales archaeon ex4572_165]
GFALLFEIILLVIQIVMVVFLFVLVPFLWYRLVNKYSLKEIFRSIQLKKEQLDMSFLWGVITAIIALGFVLIIGVILSVSGVADENASNIKDLELLFSLPTILILITFQPIAEEIFFRGFLLDKLQKPLGKNPAIIVTSLLFGVAHISMGNVIPAIIISVVALVLGYMVVKTKSLMTGIIAHVIFNIISFLLYLIGKQILSQGLIL